MNKLSAVQPSYVFCMCVCVCVCVYLMGGLLMFSSIVLSLQPQQETATEILRSQGTIGFQEEEEEEGKLQ